MANHNQPKCLTIKPEPASHQSKNQLQPHPTRNPTPTQTTLTPLKEVTIKYQTMTKRYQIVTMWEEILHPNATHAEHRINFFDYDKLLLQIGIQFNFHFLLLQSKKAFISYPI